MLKNRTPLILISIFAALAIGGTAIAGGNGKGKIKPFSLEISALRNADDSVDVYVDVDVVEDYQGTYSAPILSKHIQLKSFDLAGDLRWTQNYQDELLTANTANTSSTASFTYTDMLYRQPVRAQVQVQNVETTNTEVLRNVAEVLWRPDLAVTSVSAPEENTVEVPFDVVATINELNKDLGGTADIVLYDGTNELMRVPAVPIEPDGPTVISFEEVSFDTAGTYTLTVAIENEEPGDYDASNNSADVTVTIVDAFVSVDSRLQYYHISRHQLYEWDNIYGKGINENTYVYYDSTQIWIFSGPDAEFSFPVDLSYRLEVDGSVFATDDLMGLTSNYSYYYYDRHYSLLAPGQWIMVLEYDNAYYPTASDFAYFRNYAYRRYYYARREDTDGDGILETIYDYDVNYYGYGDPIAGKSLPTSIAAELSVTSGGTTYLGTASASGTELADQNTYNYYYYCYNDYDYEGGTRGQNYYRSARDCRTVSLNKYISGSN
jgi:hypothetical protein